MKIDLFCQILAPKYFDRMTAVSTEKGTFNIRETIKDIDGLPISESDRRQIYEGNARQVFVHILLRSSSVSFVPPVKPLSPLDSVDSCD